MLWYLPWSENIKKRACRYLLQRYLGNFLEEKLTLDQLSVDLYNGTGTVCDVSLDCEALNELGDSQNWPLEIVDGYMQKITVTIPWSTILKDDSMVEVNGLSLTVQPKVRPEPVSSMLESMWSSMSSSMQLAAECLRQEDGPPDAHPVEGIEMFAHAIDSILSRVKVRFVNTKIRIEHVPKNSDRGIALEIYIKHIEYYDEAGTEPPPDATDPDNCKTYIVSTYTNKKILFDGVTLYTDEFPSKFRTMARSLIMEKSTSPQIERTLEGSHTETELNFLSTTSDIFYETKSVIQPEVTTEEVSSIPEVVRETPKREISSEERSNQPDPILFAKLTGRQELALKIKHSEEAVGPKVDLQITMGSLIVFLTPRQLHTLLELFDGLNQPHLEDTSNIPLRGGGLNMQCKPMGQADFQLIEAQLMGNFTSDLNKPKLGMWTGQSFEESDTETERFQPMGREGSQMADSFSSTASSMSASATSSVHMPYIQPSSKRNRRVPQIDGDPTAEVSHINIKISSCSCILLHKDILVPLPLGTDCINPCSARKLQEFSTQFFERLGFLTIICHNRQDLEHANELFDNAAKKSHLRLITSSISIDGSEKTTSHGSQTNCEVDVTQALLKECLYNSRDDMDTKPECFDLVRFDIRADPDDDSDFSSTMATQPCIRVLFKQTLKYVRIGGGEKKLLYPTTDITIKCLPLFVDVELTVLDRISATIFPATPAAAPPVHAPQQQNQLNLALCVSHLDAVLRFPIADLRPGVNRERRNVRPDYLLFRFDSVSIGCQQLASSRALPTTYTVRADTIFIDYYENEESCGIHVARADMDQSFESNMLRGSTPALPLISITFQPKSPPRGPFDPLSDDDVYEPPPSTNLMATSMYIMDKLRDKGAPTPFSSKKTAHQSVTKHEDTPNGQIEELIVPGSVEEMAEFTSSSIESSSIHLDINLPILSMQLESKQLYELIYNRISNDLLLWEPQTCDQFEISPHMAFAQEPNIYPAFSMCRNPGYDSESESSTSEDDNIYYSTYDNKAKQKKMAANKAANQQSGPHNFCFTLKVGKGVLTVLTPVRDSNKRVVPGQMGELVLDVGKLSMCQVSGLHGRAKTAQLCLRAHRTTLYHDAVQTIPSERPPLRRHGTALLAHLKETIYPSDKGVLLKDNVANKDMLTLALNVEPQMELPNFKKICLALGIERATLRHRGNVGIAWLTQLLDVIDVVEYPVPGYRPSAILTELHAHLANCSVDYRPLYLPIRTVLTLGNFTVSSNVLAQTNTSSLRFLAQDCALFLSHLTGFKVNEPVPQGDDLRPDLMKEYVCVCDVGLFELSLRMADKATANGPHLDLSASNNTINIHTCWDSASALCRLVTYLANDADCTPGFSCDEDPLLGLDNNPEEIRELSPSEIQQVNDMMAEAMKESPNSTSADEETNNATEKEGVEIFFFPDESNVNKLKAAPSETSLNSDRYQENSEQKSDDKQNDDTGSFKDSCTTFDDSETALEDVAKDVENILNIKEDYISSGIELAAEAKPTSVHVANELGDPSASPRSSPRKTGRYPKHRSSEGNNTDDEYCIVDTQPYTVEDELAEPVVKWFGNEPVPLIDNHFTVPPAKSDVLNAPKNFPPPILRYTLCEMSIIWHIFGGNDFKLPGDTTNNPRGKKNVSINEPGSKHGSPTTAKCNIEYEPYGERGSAAVSYRAARRVSADAATWRTRGGSQRDRNTAVQIALTKVKFQHETYPAGGTHASRQTLAISKIEVLDRLSNSHINKFLSQYVMKDEPERKNAHMLVIKSVHVRPEPSQPAQECCLKISLLPLRFNIDQDTLAFLISFFSKLGEDDVPEESESCGSGSSHGSRHTTPTHRAPVMGRARHSLTPLTPHTPHTPLTPTDTRTPHADTVSIPENEPLMESYEAERLVSENLIQLEEDFQLQSDKRTSSTSRTTPEPEIVDDSPVYFRRVVFSPEVPIRLDYVGKRVDLSAGPVAGLLMGLGQLNCSELRLKRLYHRHGLLGLERLLKWALHEWLSDIKRHQLPGLLSGIGPMHSLLQLIRGIRDLVWLPVEQWRRDGRIVHGLRRGAASFTARTAVAALDITARILHIIQATAETAFDMLTPGATLQLQSAYDRREKRRRRRRDPARQATDIREGVANAYTTLTEGIAETALTVALAARSERGVGVLRHLPGAAVAPLALAAAGAADLVGGVRASLAPLAARDLADKWRPHNDDT